MKFEEVWAERKDKKGYKNVWGKDATKGKERNIMARFRCGILPYKRNVGRKEKSHCVKCAGKKERHFKNFQELKKTEWEIEKRMNAGGKGK